jgi:hypothetical protein
MLSLTQIDCSVLCHELADTSCRGCKDDSKPTKRGDEVEDNSAISVRKDNPKHRRSLVTHLKIAAYACRVAKTTAEIISGSAAGTEAMAV